MAILYGNETASSVKRSQVYLATHNGEGNSLPFMYRSFISFTYGGKKIEDFDLIATVNGDRINRSAYASFDDTVTTYDNLDGQHYWATHYKTNQMDFVLSTDGIDDKQLDNFKHWFKAGISRELILAEHPNRAIMARVATPPTINLLPFEQDVEILISGKPYKTKTTLYKGDIQLSLVMDSPHWYAIQNILGEKVLKSDGKEYYEDVWRDLNSNEPISVFASQDALKILYEDGIPLGSMIQENMLLGNGTYANVKNDDSGKIWSIPEAQIIWTEGEPSGVGARIAGVITEEEWLHNSRLIIVTDNYDLITTENETTIIFDKQFSNSFSEGASLEDENEETITTEDENTVTLQGRLAYVSDYHDYLPKEYKGKIAGPIVDVSGKGITILSSNQYGYFFYSGTAPSPTIISFTLTPQFSGNYISEPCNGYINDNKKYNVFTIESLTRQDLYFTTPNIYTSYNAAQKIFETYANNSYTWENVRENLRDTVRHPKVREYAILVLNTAQGDSNDSVGVSVSYLDLQANMKKFFIGNTYNAKSATFVFNSKTGEATGSFSYYPDGSTLLENQKENVGDMLRSNYIFIQDRNYPTSQGIITGWTDTTDATKQYSHRIYHDVDGGLTNVQVLYKNMYL